MGILMLLLTLLGMFLKNFNIKYVCCRFSVNILEGRRLPFIYSLPKNLFLSYNEVLHVCVLLFCEKNHDFFLYILIVDWFFLSNHSQYSGINPPRSFCVIIELLGEFMIFEFYLLKLPLGFYM